ncbi:hypothetical protein ABT352_33230 [Streptosporangium sp. NPDC000563]|uniref:hypothetical protein n=1 Tax=Streptosporangium sp. NPDC000563 TaxID=3154366 RepID=UPI003328DC86
MAEWAKLIEAIAGLVGAIAWPVAIVLAAGMVMRRYKAAFGRLIDRMTTLSYPGGQIELAAIEAAKLAEEESDQEAQVAELVEQAAGEEEGQEQRREVLKALAEQAEELGRVRAELDLLRNRPVVESGGLWPSRQPPPSGFPSVPDFFTALVSPPEENMRRYLNRAEVLVERRRRENEADRRAAEEADRRAAEVSRSARLARQDSEHE